MNLRRIYDVITRRNIGLRDIFVKRLFATESMDSKQEIVDITSADEKPIYSDADNVQVQEIIVRKRNKSRLNPHHRNMLMGLRPYDKPLEWYHNTVKYKKRMLGKYGLNAIDEPAGFAWPTLEEVEDAKLYERVAFPLSLQERWQKLEEKRKETAAAVIARENELLEKVAKMDKWSDELNAKIAKKEAELEKARLRKERLVEEIRRHFGFKISPKDTRFKDMMAQKEKEEKKKKKEAKKKAKLDKMMSFAQEQLKKTDIQEKSKDKDNPTIDSTKSTE